MISGADLVLSEDEEDSNQVFCDSSWSGKDVASLDGPARVHRWPCKAAMLSMVPESVRETKTAVEEAATNAWRLLQELKGPSASLDDLARLLAPFAGPVTVRQGLGGCPRASAFVNQRHTFLLCNTQACSASDKGLTLIVDPSFQQQLLLGHADAEYAAFLDTVPAVFVGTYAMLQEAVAVSHRAMGRAFIRAGSSCPPWRQGPTMLLKWSPPNYKDRCYEAPQRDARCAHTAGSAGQPTSVTDVPVVHVARGAAGAPAEGTGVDLGRPFVNVPAGGGGGSGWDGGALREQRVCRDGLRVERQGSNRPQQPLIVRGGEREEAAAEVGERGGQLAQVCAVRGRVALGMASGGECGRCDPVVRIVGFAAGRREPSGAAHNCSSHSAAQSGAHASVEARALEEGIPQCRPWEGREGEAALERLSSTYSSTDMCSTSCSPSCEPASKEAVGPSRVAPPSLAAAPAAPLPAAASAARHVSAASRRSGSRASPFEQALDASDREHQQRRMKASHASADPLHGVTAATTSATSLPLSATAIGCHTDVSCAPHLSSAWNSTWQPRGGFSECGGGCGGGGQDESLGPQSSLGSAAAASEQATISMPGSDVCSRGAVDWRSSSRRGTDSADFMTLWALPSSPSSSSVSTSASASPSRHPISALTARIAHSARHVRPFHVTADHVHPNYVTGVRTGGGATPGDGAAAAGGRAPCVGHARLPGGQMVPRIHKVRWMSGGDR